jgi:hypothetical protein
MPSLILASSSPRRAELLRQLTLNFKVVPSTVTEIHHDQLSVREAAQINAYRKARSVAKKYPDTLVLGADTLVCLDMTLFGKPASLEEACAITASEYFAKAPRSLFGHWMLSKSAAISRASIRSIKPGVTQFRKTAIKSSSAFPALTQT